MIFNLFFISFCNLTSNYPFLGGALYADRIVWVSVVILVCLFMVQRFGTDKVGYTFAPIICVWFMLIAGIGVYNFFKFDATVVKAINPIYIVYYFKRNKKKAWVSLGGIVLSITGLSLSLTHRVDVYSFHKVCIYIHTHTELMYILFVKCVCVYIYIEREREICFKKLAPQSIT